MPNWVAVLGTSRAAAAAFDDRVLRINVRFNTGMCTTVREPLAKYEYRSDLEVRAAKSALQQAEFSVGMGVI